MKRGFAEDKMRFHFHSSVFELVSWTKSHKPIRYRQMISFGQMFAMKPTIAHLVILLVISLTLAVSKEGKVDARLIEIYHKYKPKVLVEPLNSSASTSLEQIGDSEEQAMFSKSIEYTSPMKKIMELLTNHSPVIVLSDSAGQQQEQQQQQEQPVTSRQQIGTSADNTLSSLVQAQNPALGAATASDQQHWTMVNPNQIIQPLLTSQQQQFVQSTLPFSQYYMSPNQLAEVSNQFGILAPNLGFSPATTYQHIATLPYPSADDFQAQQASLLQQQLVQQQQQQQQQQNSLEDRAQPVFLSSYVPEVPIQSKPAIIPPTILQLAPNKKPDSIQQIQQSQDLTQSHIDSPRPDSGQSSQDTSDQDAGDDNDGDSEKNASMDESSNDVEEPTKIKRSNSDIQANDQSKFQSDEPEEPPNGSMVYENKYDSDKDEPSTKSSRNLKADSSNVLNGLVNVGLNDDCLQCICRASSGCDHLLRCITRGSDEKYCGPFQLTEEYWNRAGSPGDASNNFLSFEDCANEADCAVETVTNYMKKYHKDCDGDENITCMDYARLHRLKPSECDNTDKLINEFDAYWPKFQRCAEGYNRSRNGDDEDI